MAASTASPELFIIGSIDSGTGFPNRNSYYVSFEVVVGNQWNLISGMSAGNSHIMESRYDGVCWNTPLDMQFGFQSIQGWPKISLRVWSVDGYGRKDLEGYGVAFVPMPTKQDEVTVEISTWKPSYYHRNFFQRFLAQTRQAIMGGNPVLRDDTLVHTNDNRMKLYTTSGGVVTLKLTVISRNSEAAGIKFD